MRRSRRGSADASSRHSRSRKCSEEEDVAASASQSERDSNTGLATQPLATRKMYRPTTLFVWLLSVVAISSVLILDRSTAFREMRGRLLTTQLQLPLPFYSSADGPAMLGTLGGNNATLASSTSRFAAAVAKAARALVAANTSSSAFSGASSSGSRGGNGGGVRGNSGAASSSRSGGADRDRPPPRRRSRRNSRRGRGPKAAPVWDEAAPRLSPDAHPQVLADLRPWERRGIALEDLEITKVLLRKPYLSEQGGTKRKYPALATPLPAAAMDAGVEDWISAPADGIFTVIVKARVVYFMYDDAKFNAPLMTLPGRAKVGSLYLMLSEICSMYRVPDVQFLWNVNPTSHLRPPDSTWAAPAAAAVAMKRGRDGNTRGSGVVDGNSYPGGEEDAAVAAAEEVGGVAAGDGGVDSSSAAQAPNLSTVDAAEIAAVADPPSSAADAAATGEDEEEAEAEGEDAGGEEGGADGDAAEEGEGAEDGGGGASSSGGGRGGAPRSSLGRRLLQSTTTTTTLEDDAAAAAAPPPDTGGPGFWTGLMEAVAAGTRAPRGIAPVFSMCKRAGDLDVLCPNSYFRSPNSWNFSASGLLTQAAAHPWAERGHKVWWRGASGDTWPAAAPRAMMVSRWFGEDFTDIVFTNNWAAVYGGWVRRKSPWLKKKLVHPRGARMPWGDTYKQPVSTAARHRYALHLPGSYRATYSRALQYLLWTGTAVFFYDAPYFEFYYGGLQPWVHFIPVNLTNLRDRHAWAEAHPERAAAIAAAGLAFAREHLSSRGIAQYWVGLLREYAKLQRWDAGRVPRGACGCWTLGVRPPNTPRAVVGHCPLICDPGPMEEGLKLAAKG